ncbi:MAG: IS3 family transposase, partial [Solirubrobacterales bacterium]
MYRFVERERASHHVVTLCRVLDVSRAGYHAWVGRPARRRAVADTALTERIRTIHDASRGTYGAPRIHAALRATGIRVGRKRVARLMRTAGVLGVHRRRRSRPIPRPVPRAATTAPDLVRRRFRATAPDRLWVADITELPSGEGPLFLASIVDAWSRACVGWSMADHLRTSLVLDALQAALDRRQPGPGLIHHSDRGTQYTSVALGARLASLGIAASMGSPGSGLDNALAESFFASLETE